MVIEEWKGDTLYKKKKKSEMEIRESFIKPSDECDHHPLLYNRIRNYAQREIRLHNRIKIVQFLCKNNS